MASVNSRLKDRQISHQVDLQQYSNGVVQRIIAILNRTDADLAAKVRQALQRVPAATTFSVERLDALLQSVKIANSAAYEIVGRTLTEEMQALVGYEIASQMEMFTSTIPPGIQVSYASVSTQQAYAAAMSRPFQGRLLKEWVSTLDSEKATRIRDAVRVGFLEGETIDQIVRRVRGSRTAKYADGVIQTDRRNAEAVVRTAVAHTASTARDTFYGANSDIIKSLEWSSTLDLRTSEGCRVRDGKHYHPVSHKPVDHSIPWSGGPGRLHWRCRSSSIPVLKSLKEMGINMEDLPQSTRASMDGQVGADVAYSDWLKSQSASRQDQVVGPTRGRLMRAGKLPFDSMYTNRGESLTLEELYSRHSEAFKRAGIAKPG